MHQRAFEISETLYPFDSNWVEIKDHVIPSANHFFQSDEPDQIANAIEKLFDSTT